MSDRHCIHCNRPTEIFSIHCKRCGIAARLAMREFQGNEPWKPGGKGAIPLCHDDGTPVTDEERRLHHAIIAGRRRRRTAVMYSLP